MEKWGADDVELYSFNEVAYHIESVIFIHLVNSFGCDIIS